MLYLQARSQLHLGSYALSGIKKFYRACRRSLEVSSLCLKNWGKMLIREKALPVPAEVVNAMVAVAIRRGGVAFAGRTG